MIVSKAPMRISLFGGSTDYPSFYKKHGSLIIGTTINKYAYNTIRYRPKIVGEEYVITYSLLERVKKIEEVKNPLIREILRYYRVFNPIELNFASDIPSRTGLGGSSSCCVSLASSICSLLGLPVDKKQICLDAIKIEREILGEPGGIQDQIWACYGGLNVIKINHKGEFNIKKLPITDTFKKEVEDSMLLIYTGRQRTNNAAAESHGDKDKIKIMYLAKESMNAFFNENLKAVGELLYQSWEEKRALSPHISNTYIDSLVRAIMKHGAYGVKLLGSGDGGFLLVMCNARVKKKLQDKYKKDIVEFKFETEGLVNTKI